MSESDELKTLGMDRRIPRRDFLNGVAIGAGATLAALRFPHVAAHQNAAAGSDARVYPPARAGLRGHYPAAIERFGPIERGEYTRFPASEVETGEDYDLVVIGGTATRQERSSPSSASTSAAIATSCSAGCSTRTTSGRRRSSTRSTSARIASLPARGGCPGISSSRAPLTGAARRDLTRSHVVRLPAAVDAELPQKQRDALAYSVKVPMMYNTVLIRQWTAFQKLGVSSINGPCMYHPSASLDPGTSVGGYRGITTPDEPILMHLVRNPNKPGLPRKAQNRAGQQELLQTSFAQFELEIRRQLARELAGGGFDPAADIVGITVNRWPWGYSYTYDTLDDPDLPPEERPHVIGRQRFGQIAIANADAGAAAFTNQAIDEAHRAVQELFVSRGLS